MQPFGRRPLSALALFWRQPLSAPGVGLSTARPSRRRIPGGGLFSLSGSPLGGGLSWRCPFWRQPFSVLGVGLSLARPLRYWILGGGLFSFGWRPLSAAALSAAAALLAAALSAASPSRRRVPGGSLFSLGGLFSLSGTPLGAGLSRRWPCRRQRPFRLVAQGREVNLGGFWRWPLWRWSLGGQPFWFWLPGGDLGLYTSYNLAYKIYNVGISIIYNVGISISLLTVVRLTVCL